MLKCLKGQWLVAGALCACAVVSVGLACCGAERSLDFMKYYAAIGTVGALGVVCLLACFWTWRRPAALLLHLGLALVLGGWTYNELAGVPDGYLKLHAGRTGSVDGDFEFTLDRFEIDRWPDTGTVRQYTSHGRIGEEKVDISVNHPLVRDGWWVYQSSFEEMENPHTGEPFYFTILQCVKDAGLPLVALGGALLLAGALWLAFATPAFATPKGCGSQDGCRVVAQNAPSPSALHLSPFTSLPFLARWRCWCIGLWQLDIRRCRTCTSSSCAWRRSFRC